MLQPQKIIVRGKLYTLKMPETIKQQEQGKNIIKVVQEEERSDKFYKIVGK